MLHYGKLGNTHIDILRCAIVFFYILSVSFSTSIFAQPSNKKSNIEQDTLCLDTLPLNDERRYRWGNIEYVGEPWVRNVSKPNTISRGLYNRHISLWASHGRYYDQTKGLWKWQRPKLYGTTEDLFTQTIVVPYLIPMLENAGAVVFTPRERDWQRNEVIVDNDDNPIGNRYSELNARYDWCDSGLKGFAYRKEVYRDMENPFEDGTLRMVQTTNKESEASTISYQPNIPQDGRYAVYVSYQTLENSVDDASYTVWHKGESTSFKVNQQMGGGTWVYLGTFDFAEGSSEANRVVVSNLSNHKGIVTADAVRFGGGMGNIERFGVLSELPRCLEGARYYAQWAGMPDTIFSLYEGEDDYKDDLNVRSLMTNYLGGGSCYIPTLPGKKVPFELSLAIHSDAGYSENGDSLTATMTICTTKHNDGLLDSGISRYASFELGNDLLTTITADLKATYGDWYHRGMLNRNYSESRRPEIPSIILETLSHQNFLDMRMAQDPNFRFTLARAIYKTALRHIAKQHDVPYVVTPLAPNNFKVEFVGQDEVRLSWDATTDSLEESAKPSGYIVYTSVGDNGFDNGIIVSRGTSHTVRLIPGTIYSFKVAAFNDGGQSFPSETLCAAYHPQATKTILLVDAFQRLSSPAVVDSDSLWGFDFDVDPGVTYGPTFGWVGRQDVFERGLMDEELEFYSGWSNDDFTGMLVAGNEKDNIRSHAEAIHATGKYNIVSCSRDVMDNACGNVNEHLSDYPLIDLILGLECNDGHSLKAYKTFTPAMQKALNEYVKQGGRLFVSGAFVGTDMQSEEERNFLNNVLKCSHAGIYRLRENTIKGMGTSMAFYNAMNEKHYATVSADILEPTDKSFAMLLYANGNSAGVAYQGKDYRSIVLGFPFECITNTQKQKDIMGGILKFLLNE